ncbi:MULTISPECIES: nitroreductase [Sphingomonas]|jgi:nitroreductase|uniref:nitroreductase family protein n=1 Tax=Sphingomonas TaxID=13687 RepID=UPI0004DB8451|nr:MULTISPECIES: nitroreductase [Sphingomonas]RZM33815.1 MAG: nitroreductase [Sphingomonas sp.]KQM92623.1 nitroreductase [Sphingomonas sp. Leaf226]KQN21783.1 nitroreductase [Sphingomonas sp. Leaf30]MBB3586854.1 nitroreductase [Sphingomonas sp. BK481]MBD8551126.1 nitroreductase [Sphingomonas sp. CFBP 8764]
MFNDTSSPLSLLATRRSGKPRDLVAPGPDADQLAQILAIAARTPDHGKLAPWRFVVVGQDQRTALAALIIDAYRVERPTASRTEIEALDQFAHQAPALVVVLSSPKPSHIPVFEQELSTGAACMNLLHAVHALGFAGGWLTGWPSYSDTVRDAFGEGHERIAGFLFVGTPSRPLDERPRPDMERVVSRWRP